MESQIKYYSESKIREIIKEPFINMLNTWTSLSREVLGGKMEVILIDRHDHPMTKKFEGEINTAKPEEINREMKLLVLLESLESINYTIFTHEVGHWALKLKRFPAIKLHTDIPNHDIEILLNSLIQHPPLYSLQRSLNINPQEEIDSRAEHNIKLFGSDNEIYNEELIILNALTVADDLLSCTENMRTKLYDIMLAKHPETCRLIDIIVEAKEFYDLDNPQGNLKFAAKLMKELNIKYTWSRSKEVSVLKSLVRKKDE